MNTSSTILRSAMRNSLRWLLLICISANGLSAQQVNVSTTVMSPYVYDVLEYAYKTNVMLIAQQFADDVHLNVEIKGRNGVNLSSDPNHDFNSLFVLDAGVPYRPSGFELEEYFDLNNLTVSGISRNRLMRDGLPEGSYQICIQVIHDDGTVLSPSNSGCSNLFTINYIDPPRIISPVCGKKITNTQAQNLVFSWTNPPGAQPNTTEYTLRIVEMSNPDLPAQQALNSNALAFFEETARSRNTFYYGPNQPLLENGKKYAFEVIAFNDELRLKFDNNGRSQACWFQWGDEDDGFSFIPLAIDEVEANENIFSPPTQNNSTVAVDESVDAAPWLDFSFASVHGRLLYYYADQHVNKSRVLANMPVKFRVRYYLEQNAEAIRFLDDGKMSDVPDELKKIPDNMILGSVVTDASGNFDLNFSLHEEMGKLSDYIKVGSGDVDFHTGSLHRAIFIEVEDPHFCSPLQPIVVQPKEAKDVGDISSKVRSYQLNVQLSSSMHDDISYNSKNLDNIEVLLLRPSVTPIGVPNDEVVPNSSIENETFLNLEVVGKARSATGGKATFARVIYNEGNTDRYFIAARSAEEQDHYYVSGISVYQKTQADYNEEISEGGVNIGFIPFYNRNYQNRIHHLDMVVVPQDPMIHGDVQDQRNRIVEGAAILLMKYDSRTITQTLQGPLGNYTLSTTVPDISIAGVTTSNQAGDYSISFNPNHQKSGDYYQAVPYGITAIKKGYNKFYSTINQLGNEVSLIQFAKRYERNIRFTPEAVLHGKITSESRQGVSCHVYAIDSNGKQLGKSEQSSTLLPSINFNTGAVSYPEYSTFELDLPSGSHFLVIDPLSNDYFTDTIAINVSKGDNELTHVVTKRAHRLEILAVNAKYQYTAPLMLLPADYYVPFARAKVLERTDEKVADARGLIRFDPFLGGSQFTVEVKGPEGLDYEVEEITVQDAQPNKTYKRITVYLKKAAHITGKITAEGLPLEDAEIRLSSGSSTVIQTTSNSEGNYDLRNVPIANDVYIAVSKVGSDLIGETRKLDIPGGGLSDVNFDLRQEESINWSNIWGFPAGVESAREEGGSWIISGILSGFAEDNGLIAGSDHLTFNELKVKPRSATDLTAVPTTTSVSLDENQWALVYQSDIKLIQQNADDGLQLTEVSSGVGGISGQIRVDAGNSFDDPSLSFDQESIFLTSGDQAEAEVSMTATSDSWDVRKFKLADENGRSINYKWMGFDLSSVVEGSKINDQQLEWDAVLHTDLEHVEPADLQINLGKMQMGREQVASIYSDQAISMKLDQWDLIGQNWALSNAGLHISTGTLKTHVVDVPFNGMEIKPNQLQYGNYHLDQLTLNGVLDLTVTGEVDFYHEGQHWKLVAVKGNGEEAATIQALPAMDKDLSISDLSLLSDGTGKVNVAPVNVKLHDLAVFKPEQIIAVGNTIKIPGLLSMGVPDLPLETTAIVYTKQGNQLKFALQPYTAKFTAKGVHLDFDVTADALTASGLYLEGKLFEPGLYEMNVALAHNSSSTKINTRSGNEFKIGNNGSRKLVNIEGEMIVVDTRWDNFHFAGDLTGTTGMSGRLAFKVSGDIYADDEAVDVKNIETPFGDLALSYDFSKAQLRGHLSFDKELGSSGRAQGAAEFMVGDGGWYFAGGATLEMKDNPYIKKANMAMVFADYSIGSEPYVRSIFETYSYFKKLPSAFNDLTGFFIDGSAEIPAPYVPDVDIDLVVVSGRLTVRAGGDFNLGMNFSDGPNYYRTGAELYVTGHAGIGGSIGVACAGASFDAKLTVNALGEYYSNGDWFVNASSTLRLTGSAYAGGGCCDSDCDHIWPCPAPCFSDRWSGTKSFGLRFHMGSDENYFKVDL